MLSTYTGVPIFSFLVAFPPHLERDLFLLPRAKENGPHQRLSPKSRLFLTHSPNLRCFLPGHAEDLVFFLLCFSMQPDTSLVFCSPSARGKWAPNTERFWTPRFRRGPEAQRQGLRALRLPPPCGELHPGAGARKPRDPGGRWVPEGLEGLGLSRFFCWFGSGFAGLFFRFSEGFLPGRSAVFPGFPGFCVVSGGFSSGLGGRFLSFPSVFLEFWVVSLW